MWDTWGREMVGGLRCFGGRAATWTCTRAGRVHHRRRQPPQAFLGKAPPPSPFPPTGMAALTLDGLSAAGLAGAMA